MQKPTFLLLILGFSNLISYGQDAYRELYRKAFEEQHKMLKGEISANFKRAVFIAENVFYNDSLEYENFKSEITETGNKLKSLISQRGLIHYKTAGNWAVYTYMTDSLPINNFMPYTYDFDDFMGERDFSKMFTTKLMRTKSGNCHSLPYYYKILCEEIGATAYLALAPNHIYIKHIDEKGQWANVELTSGGFPRDQWIIKQMAISVEAIKNEIYMKPLSEKESVALTIFDLASAYEFQFDVDSFYLSIVDTALTYFPNCIPLLMSKANYFAKTGINEQKKSMPNPNRLKELYNNQKDVYIQINNLEYKNIPLELYEQWVQSLKNEKLKRKIAPKR